MADYKSKKVWGGEECDNYQSSSNVSQRITDFTSDVTVTLDNPHCIHNATATAGLVFAKIGAETVFKPYYLQAGQTEVIEARTIGGTGEGTTVTDLMVRGRE